MARRIPLSPTAIQQLLDENHESDEESEYDFSDEDDPEYIPENENDFDDSSQDDEHISDEEVADLENTHDTIEDHIHDAIEAAIAGTNEAQESEDDEPLEDMTPWQRYLPTDPDLGKFLFTVPQPGFQIPGNIRPHDAFGYFQLFFTDELLTEITNATNLYAAQKIQKATPLQKYSSWHTWTAVSLLEMKAFLGVILNMAINGKPDIESYFSCERLDRMPFFKEVFSRKRFLQIFWALHLVPPVDSPTVVTPSKVRVVSDYIDTKCRELFVPYTNIAVDESTVGFKGRVLWKCYNPKKPTKWGLRIYSVCDSSTGYVCGIVPYYGKCTTRSLVHPELPFTTRIVLHLVQKILASSNGSGYHVFTDRFYTSPCLAEKLMELNVHITGTVMPNRKHFPKELKKPKIKTYETLAYQKSNKIMALSFLDKRMVSMLSTNYNSATVPYNRYEKKRKRYVLIEKPNVILQYTKFMGAVDRADHYIGSYSFSRKSYKWWRKLFFWLLEVAIVNSYILSNIDRKENGQKPQTHLEFRKKLIIGLVGDVKNPTARKRGRPSTGDHEERLNGQPHFIMPIPNKSSKDCAVCSNRKVRGGRREAVYFCETCTRKPGLHPGICFKKYHTEKNYKAI